MKKLSALLLIAVMAAVLLAGCSDPVFDDLESFLDVEMSQINADYQKLTEAIGAWETLEDDYAIAKNINEVVLPLINGSLEKLEEVNPQTAEVKELKTKYTKVMNAYKSAMEIFSEGCMTQEEETINAGVDGIEKALELLDEYNTALETLAKEHGAEIQH